MTILFTLPRFYQILWSGLEFSLTNNGNFTSVSGKAEFPQINLYEVYFFTLRISEIVAFALNITICCANILVVYSYLNHRTSV